MRNRSPSRSWKTECWIMMNFVNLCEDQCCGAAPHLAALVSNLPILVAPHHHNTTDDADKCNMNKYCKEEHESVQECWKKEKLPVFVKIIFLRLTLWPQTDCRSPSWRPALGYRCQKSSSRLWTPPHRYSWGTWQHTQYSIIAKKTRIWISAL